MQSSCSLGWEAEGCRRDVPTASQELTAATTEAALLGQIVCTQGPAKSTGTRAGSCNPGPRLALRRPPARCPVRQPNGILNTTTRSSGNGLEDKQQTRNCPRNKICISGIGHRVGTEVLTLPSGSQPITKPDPLCPPGSLPASAPCWRLRLVGAAGTLPPLPCSRPSFPESGPHWPWVPQSFRTSPRHVFPSDTVLATVPLPP